MKLTGFGLAGMLDPPTGSGQVEQKLLHAPSGVPDFAAPEVRHVVKEVVQYLGVLFVSFSVLRDLAQQAVGERSVLLINAPIIECESFSDVVLA